MVEYGSGDSLDEFLVACWEFHESKTVVLMTEGINDGKEGGDVHSSVGD